MTRQEIIEQLSIIQSALLADGASRKVERALDEAIHAVEREGCSVKVGDECRYKATKTGYSFVVTYIDEEEGIFSAVYCRDGDVIADGTLSMIERTGRHYDCVEKMLEEVRP